MDRKKTAVLRKVYAADKNSTARFTGIGQVLNVANQRVTRDFRRAEVEDFLATQDVWSKHKSTKKIFDRLPTTATHLDAVWQADLVDMKKFKDQNVEFVWILTVIDCMSRFA